jgi:CBS domain-containing protein
VVGDLRLIAAGFDQAWRTLGAMQLLARDLMERNVLTVPAVMPFAEIQHLFVVAGCHGAPVVDETGNVVGLISVMDLLRAADQAFDEDRDPGEDQDFDLSQMQAIDLAAPEPVWIEAEASVLEIAQLMRREGIHRVLVREAGKLVGIVSAFDLCRAISGADS